MSAHLTNGRDTLGGEHNVGKNEIFTVSKKPRGQEENYPQVHV